MISVGSQVQVLSGPPLIDFKLKDLRLMKWMEKAGRAGEADNTGVLA